MDKTFKAKKIIKHTPISSVPDREGYIAKPEEKKMNSSFQKLEQAYSELLEKGMHDAKFVNLYDIKDLMHCSYNSMNQIIVQYYEHKKEEKIVLFTNLVQSIDKRRRFFVKKQVPVLKIKIM